ncbi:hypothetical protein PR048_014666 [Dryococelus australis]|uniref:DDE-1 domain-containing protein n=1 Tax=Dryococelus australis TaxID=614101 RepID=A0ABQ9HEV2_9NEOP|nr:hypothetical protein PR048_014666 [Dryococelus australis]
MPLISKVLRCAVYTFCKQNNICVPRDNDKNSMLGRKWFKLFLGRHPDVAQRSCQIVNLWRAVKLNVYYVRLLPNTSHGFERVRPHVQTGTNFQCTIESAQVTKVLAERLPKRVPNSAPKNVESETVVAFANSLGQAIPPVVLFMGKRCKLEYVDKLPQGSNVFMTAKGSMASSTLKVLLMDSTSHLDDNSSACTDEYDITLLCLPNNCTHEHQPMDKAIFRSFEYQWDNELQLFCEKTSGRNLNRSGFSTVFSRVWPKTLLLSNINSGLRATPYDQNIILEVVFTLSTLT